MALLKGLLAIALMLAAADAQAASDKSKPETSAKKESDAIPNDPQLTTASFGDWVERCQRVNANGEARRFCEVAATVTAAGQTAPLAEIAIGRLKKADSLRLTLVLPVNVSFPSAPTIKVGAADPLELSWRRCVPAGCFADVPFASETLRAWREAKAATVESKAASGQSFNFSISLRGLPQALEAMAKEP